MKDKVIIVGPFPQPIHGMSLANKTIFEQYCKREDVAVKKYDTTLGKNIKNKNKQGKFSLGDFFNSIYSSSFILKFLIENRGAYAYFTPGQSALGFLRYTPFLLISFCINKRTIIHIHGSRLYEYYKKSNFFFRKTIHYCISRVDTVILLGNSIKNSHQGFIPLNKISICKNGVPIPRLVRKKNSNLKILFLSNLMKDKGIFDFFNAVEKCDVKNIEVHIAGEIENQYKTEIDERLVSLKENVTYHGVVTGKNKDRLFRYADIFVLPSYDEGQPLSILEAYAYGCAVVTTDVGGIPDIFTKGENGESCQVGSPKSITDAIHRILDNGLEKYSMHNMNIANEEYSELQFFKRIDDIIRCK